jgi:hypothetical protein
MRPAFWMSWGMGMTLLCSGCMSGPLLDNPARVGTTAQSCPNPVYLPHGPGAYGDVFEHVLNVLSRYCEIAYSNRYDGRIEAFPKTAPGLERLWQPGSPDFAQRLHATLQSIRYRILVAITPADDGGFFVDVKVFKELEDLPNPAYALAGGAAFRSDPTVERQFEVIEADVVDSHWIPLGRDLKLEQVILHRLTCREQ